MSLNPFSLAQSSRYALQEVIRKLNFNVCLFSRKIIFYSEWKSKLKNSILKMSWKCAFQARPPVAFRAVQFQLNFQPYVLSRLPSSLAMLCKNRKGSCSLKNQQFYVMYSQKLRSCSMLNLLHNFWFACCFGVWDSYVLYSWEISRSHNWPEKKLFYAILWWLILEETEIVQQWLKVPAYPLYFHRKLFLNMCM